jgi:ribosomal-protein-serine acetyltransferase
MPSTPPRPPYPLRLDSNIVLKSLRTQNAEQFLAFVESNRAHLEQFDPYVTQFQGLEHTRQKLAQIQTWYEHRERLTCGIWEGRNLIGYLTCVLEPQEKAIDLGYGIAADHQGHGIITRAAKAIIDYAFNELGFEYAWIICWTNNLASMRVAEKLGFKRAANIIPANPQQSLAHDEYKYILSRT